jgi:hypothetical protein
MRDPDVFAVLGPVLAAFERLGVAHYVGGSVASSAYGTGRSTMDADLVADLSDAHIRPLIQVLQSAYYVDEHAALEAVRTRSSFNLIHLQTMFKVDIFVPKGRAFDQQVFARRRKGSLTEAGGAPEAYLASPEDVILSKLEWYERGGGVSDRQWGDVLGVLKVQGGRLDLGYLRHWAAELGLSDRLEQALRDAEAACGK